MKLGRTHVDILEMHIKNLIVILIVIIDVNSAHFRSGKNEMHRIKILIAPIDSACKETSLCEGVRIRKIFRQLGGVFNLGLKKPILVNIQLALV